ncbi:hypothetical protein [Streptomyces rishiriensis]|uniref:Lipoprotein n=1 Tax=Streptomyces rishiriensis TaxID=68264 RepID=A0ABU0NW29_STRRH|nr:hypothetical protein [Streptomyces rishiriensis]MDQ0582655.1 hypothetical protein [Streptomyces rishiriensis]
MPTRPTPPTPPTPVTRWTPRTPRRVRLIAVALTAAAALTLTACHDGEGLRDEGPPDAGAVTGTTTPSGSGAYGVAETPARSHAEPPSGNA